MSTKTLVFDLETQRLAQEVGGWDHIDRLGLAGAVTLDLATGTIGRYLEADSSALIEDLIQAGQVIGFNVLRFDYAVLGPYGLDVRTAGLEDRTIDLHEHVARATGFPVSLDNLSAATLGARKTADGFASVRWFREGHLDQVLAYCEEDVRLTHRLWEHGRSRRQVSFRDRDFRLRVVPVDW